MRRGDAAQQRHDQHADEEQRALAADAHESVEPGHRDGADHRGHHQRGQPRRDMPLARETRDHPEARLAAGWVTM